MLALMLSDLWPTYALRIHTSRLTLRLPDSEELAALAQVAADGVHKPGERPFLTPWTEGTPEERVRIVLQGYSDNHASQGVSRKLGYRHDGISKDARGDEVLVSDRLRLTAQRWAETSHPPVTVDGVEAARHMFVG